MVVARFQIPARARHHKQFRSPTPTGRGYRRSWPARFGRTSCQPPLDHRPANRRPDHLSRAPGPAAIFPWFLRTDRKVVATLVMPVRGARRATCHPVPPDLASDFDVVQDAKLTRLRLEIPGSLRPSRPLRKLLWYRFASNHPLQVLLGDLRESPQVGELILKRVVGAVIPIAPPRLSRAPQ